MYPQYRCVYEAVEVNGLPRTYLVASLRTHVRLESRRVVKLLSALGGATRRNASAFCATAIREGELTWFGGKRDTSQRLRQSSSLPFLRNQPKPLRLCRLIVSGRLLWVHPPFVMHWIAPVCATQQPLSRFARMHAFTRTTFTFARAHVRSPSRVLASEKEEAPGAYEIVARGLRAYPIAADCLNFSSSARVRRTSAMKKFLDAIKYGCNAPAAF